MNRPIWLLSVAAFMAAAMTRVTDALLPEIATSFAVPVSQAVIAITSFTFAYGLFQLAYGWIGARIGPYRTATIAAALAASGALISAMADSLTALTIGRFLSGMTVAAIIPMSMVYIGDTIAYEKRQPVIAKFLMGQVMGVIMGQAFAGLFAQLLSWRQLFLLLTLGLLIVAFALWNEQRSGRVAEFKPSATTINPWLAYLRVLEVPWSRVILGIVFIEGFLCFGTFPFLAAHLKFGFDSSALATGLTMSVFGLGGLTYTIFVSGLHRRLGETGLAFCGGFAILIGFSLLALSPVWWLLAVGAGVIGLGYYMFHNTLQTNATQMAPFDRSASIALFAFCLFVSQAIGAFIVGYLAEWTGYQPLFAIAGLSIFGLAIFFRQAKQNQSAKLIEK